LTLAPLLLLLAILGGAAAWLLYRLGGRIDAILRENYDSVVFMERLNEALERIDSSFQFALAGEAKAKEQYDANWPIYHLKLKREQDNITLPGEDELVAQLTHLTEQYRRLGEAFYARPVTSQAERRQDYFGPSGLLDTFNAIKEVAGQILDLNQNNMVQASKD